MSTKTIFKKPKTIKITWTMLSKFNKVKNPAVGKLKGLSVYKSPRCDFWTRIDRYGFTVFVCRVGSLRETEISSIGWTLL